MSKARASKRYRMTSSARTASYPGWRDPLPGSISVVRNTPSRDRVPRSAKPRLYRRDRGDH
jgi:hypothetical protein